MNRFNSRPENNPGPTRAAAASAEMLAERGLPTVLWNNDSDDLTGIAYPEHHPDGIFVPAPAGSPDPWICVPAKIDSVEDYLALRIGPLAKTKTQGLSYCGNFGVPVWDLKRDHIAAIGDDPLQPILQFWKRDGRAFFFSMRMNDLHHAWRNEANLWPAFRRTHPHLFLDPPTAARWETEFVPWLDGKGQPPAVGSNSALAYDYSRAEVRRYFLDTLREACHRYDLDGVELDWLRFPFLFRRGEVNAATMTAFVGDARGILDEPLLLHRRSGAGARLDRRPAGLRQRLRQPRLRSRLCRCRTRRLPAQARCRRAGIRIQPPATGTNDACGDRLAP
jgi:hypothetical protein